MYLSRLEGTIISTFWRCCYTYQTILSNFYPGRVYKTFATLVSFCGGWKVESKFKLTFPEDALSFDFLARVS
jgi:hypothetical protein